MSSTRRMDGFSMLEFLIAAAVVALLSTVISPFFSAASRSWDKDKRMKELAQKARDAMELMTHEVKKSGGLIDGEAANLSTTSSLDSRYVVFGTAGEETVLDNRNSGYVMNDASFFNAGTQQGGFAGDYDGTAAGVATYNFSTPLPGLYDLYAYFLSTGDAAVSVSVYDGANTDISSTFEQNSENALKWYKVCEAAKPADCGGTNIDLSGAGPYSLRVARAGGTTNMLVDGFKLVYKGIRHKVFFYDEANRRITYGSDENGFAGLPGNPALVEHVQPYGGKPVFAYYKSDGVTPAASAKDAALVRMQFEVYDPDGKVSPLAFTGQTEVKSAGGGNGAGTNESKVVISELHLQTPVQTVGFNSFDGSTGNMDNDNYGWATEEAGKDYGWLSMLENLDDGEADVVNGWFSGGRGTWATEADATAPKPAGNRAYSGTGNGSTDQRNNRNFYESSENLKWEFQFRVEAQGALVADQFGGVNKCSTFGVYLRAQDPTSNNRNMVYVEFLRKGAVCATATAYVRLAKYEGSYQVLKNAIIPGAYDDGNWHTVVIRDMWGRVSVDLDGARYIFSYPYNSGALQITNTNLVPRRKAIFAWSDTHVHFDDMKITSYDFKPVAYLTDFEGLYSDWFSCIPNYPSEAGVLSCKPAGTKECGWAIGNIASGPGSAYSGTKGAATNAAGNYNQDCDEEWYHRAAVDMQPSQLHFSFPFTHFFSWQEYPVAQTEDCSAAERGDTDKTRYYVNEANMFPLDANGQVIAAPLNNFAVPPNPYDASCANANLLLNGKRTWTNNHQPGWTELAFPVPEQNTATNLRVMFHFVSDNAATTASGHYADNPSVYPGGEWERIDTPTGPGTCFSGAYCWGTIDNANYSNYQHTALETPAVITPAWTREVTLSWVQWRDFESAATFYDGGFAEYSVDNGKTWVQFTDLELSVGYDACPIGSDPDPLSATYCTIPSIGAVCQNNDGNFTFCNELQGYDGWTFDDQSWVKVTATLSGTEFANKEMKFRFQFASDNSNTGRGWFIDDVKVTASPKVNYDWIEIYNPTPYSVDVSNWRIVMEHSYQDAPVFYDEISGDAAQGSGSTVIGPYGYALITANTPAGTTNVYDGAFFTLPAESPQARRLTIDDDAFGTLGLRNKFGKIQLKDSNDFLMDEVAYNLVFYDDMERFTENDSWLRDYTVQDWGNATHWAIGTPAGGNGPGKDHTKNAPGTGNAWYLCTNAANTVCEDYINGHETGLVPKSFDLTGSAGSNPPKLEFYFWNNVDNNRRRDGMILEVSTSGGGDFVQDPPNPDPVQLPGSSLAPGYYSRTINQASNVLNGLFAYSRDITTWTQVTGNLSAYAGQVINLRFMFGADNGTSAGGAFLDDIAVYYDWANVNANWDGVTPVLTNTLERKSWSGDSSSYKNWAASVAPYNAAPSIGTPNARNSVTQ